MCFWGVAGKPAQPANSTLSFSVDFNQGKTWVAGMSVKSRWVPQERALKVELSQRVALAPWKKFLDIFRKKKNHLSSFESKTTQQLNDNNTLSSWILIWIFRIPLIWTPHSADPSFPCSRLLFFSNIWLSFRPAFIVCSEGRRGFMVTIIRHWHSYFNGSLF